MILSPALAVLPEARLYADSNDPELIYVDMLQPAPAQGSSVIRWLPLQEQEAYLMGEVRFGSGANGFGHIPGLPPSARLLPVPWEIAPVFVWYRQGDGIEVVARGKTSGFGPSNAVFNGSVPLDSMNTPLFLAAELVCRAQIAGATVTGKGDSRAVVAALPTVVFGAQAAWDATIGQVLLELLSGLLKDGSLSLRVELDHPQYKGAAAQTVELRELALLEWAHRIQIVIAPELTLAAPAALVETDRSNMQIPLGLDWSSGVSLPLRAVRILRLEERNI